MNTVISLLRAISLFAIGFAALFFLLCEESAPGIRAFIARFVFHKAAAIVLGFLLLRLFKRWSKTDPWISSYAKSCDIDNIR